MIPPAFDYHAPQTLEEALSLLDEYGDDAKILSGGHSLIPMMKLRLAQPEHIVDINALTELEYIREENGVIYIGGLTREVALEESDIIHARLPLVSEVLPLIADPQVRNLATIGGNLAHGDPGNDHPAVMLALGATIVAQGPEGKRSIHINDFFEDFYMTALEPEEILTEIQIPVPPQGSGGSYKKLERKVGDYAVAGVAAQVTVDGSGACTSAGLALTNVHYIPFKVTDGEDVLVGSKLDKEAIEKAAGIASEQCDPSNDLRGSVEYKRAMVLELTRRALRDAANQARG
ncbi:MAG: xanthine dehydrogenase family protein subunit M [Rhodothermaceae bacterium]|nr:xanthine dehydrogenase family protein subunit M [Rhodothermaceae bacterium]